MAVALILGARHFPAVSMARGLGVGGGAKMRTVAIEFGPFIGRYHRRQFLPRIYAECCCVRSGLVVSRQVVELTVATVGSPTGSSTSQSRWLDESRNPGRMILPGPHRSFGYGA